MGGLIGIDWGTSSLRAYLLDSEGKLIEARTRPWGIRHLPNGGFDAALTEIATDWPELPRLACGMVGSRDGWLAVPYINIPAHATQLSSTIHSLCAKDGMDVHIVSGLRNPSGPNVMRGEETQLIGALALRPGLATHSNWVFPGTHSKWVSVCDGDVVDFFTLMTGELFALIRQHSILCTDSNDASVDTDAFKRGVIAARDSGAAGAFSRLFSARALMLDGQLEQSCVPEYLSGLLIGEEFRSSLASNRFHLDEPFHLIGDTGLCARYRQAASHFDIDLAEPLVDCCAHGLWQIARHAGLLNVGATNEAPSC